MFSIDYTELVELVDDLEHDLNMVKDIADDDTFVEELRTIMADNFGDIWVTKGRAIGSDWNGKTLVQTGNLRDSLRNEMRLRVRRVGPNLLVFDSSVFYAQYVNSLYRFYGITDEAEGDMASAVGAVLRKKGKLNWS
jgi:hypothetical protein